MINKEINIKGTTEKNDLTQCDSHTLMVVFINFYVKVSQKDSV